MEIEVRCKSEIKLFWNIWVIQTTSKSSKSSWDDRALQWPRIS